MQITQISLQNFRNFETIDAVEFPSQAMLVAAAPNATGKTNFLEAMVMLLRGKSFRASAAECVRWGEEAFILRGDVSSSAGESGLAVRYHTPTKKLRIEENGLPVSPVTFYSHYPLVVFLPEDTFLFMRGPAERRNFLNHILVSSPAYLGALVQYHRALKQRNALLKKVRTVNELEVWSQLIMEYSQQLWQLREGFVQFIQTHLNDLYVRLSSEKKEFKVRLVTSPTVTSDLAQTMHNSFAIEQRYGFTLYGPHRDDLEITMEGHPISSALSRGQMRSVVIALKIAAHRYLIQTVGEEPLLLLDEVLSELDEVRQQALLQNLPDTQTLFTCTVVPRVLQERDNVHLLDLRSVLVKKPLTAPVPVGV